MNADDLRALQSPLKEHYRNEPGAALITLRAEGRLVVVCLHPTAAWQLELLAEICERFVFVGDGRLVEAPDLTSLATDARVRRYLGELAPA